MKNKKTEGKRTFIISLVIIVLTLAVGYALFAEALNISGTATTSGDFDVEFFDATFIGDRATGTAVIAGDKNSLTISVDLEEPTSSATVNVVVRNVGSIDAELLSVDVTGDNDLDINVTYPTFDTVTVLSPLGTYEFDILIEWPEGSTGRELPLEFTATMNYQQAL